jgi:DNA-binding GntR family transcriptional regulator
MQSVPKYFSISREIIGRIKNGDLRPGMKVPSENDLIAGYEISNTTARKVLREIEAAGWVTRVKGKGTYVRDRSVERSAVKILSFTTNMLQAGLKPSTTALDARSTPSGHSAVVNGRRYTMKGPVFKVHRLRFAESTPMMLETRYINPSLCPGIENQDLTSSLYAIYMRTYGLQLTEVNQMMRATLLDESARSFFDVPETTPAIRVESVTFCGKELILEMEDSIYRGDKYRFSVRATP